MKRLFTFALVALITAPTFAQSQLAQRRVAHTRLHQAVQADRLDKEAKVAALEKAVAADEVGFTRLVSKDKHTTFGQKLTLSERSLFVAPAMRIIQESRRNAPSKVTTETEGNVTITKDEHGIITDVTGVEARNYKRAGQAFYYSSGVKYTTQSGITKLVIDGNNVYWNEPISRLTDGSWIKGIKDGNKITFATHQPMEYISDANTTVSARWVCIPASGSGIASADDYADSFTFVIDGDVMTLQGSAEWNASADAYIMGVVWDDKGSFTGYGDSGTVLTYDPNYTPASTELVTLPDGVTAEGWYLNAVSVSADTETPISNQNVKVAFTGNDIYVQGVFDDFPSAWIKGTKNGNSYVFDKFQFLGNYGSYSIWAIGVDAAGTIVDATATYDASAKALTFNTDLLANAAEDRIYYLTWLADLVVSAEEMTFEEPVLNEKTATLPYFNSFDSDAETAEVAIYDANNDGKTFAFASDPKFEGNIAARYTYHSDNAANDYLVFPAVQLEVGKVYSVSIGARAQGASYPERVSVLCGKESKVSALKTEVIAPTTVSSVDDYVKIANNAFTIAESGMYTIAVKACSDKDQYQLWVDNFSVKEMVTDVPAAGTDLTIVPDANGANKATVTVTAPAKKLDGTALGADLTMTINVDGVKAVEKTVAPGASISEEVTVDAPGFHTVSVVFANDKGSSDAVSAKAFIGVDVPTAPTAFTLADKSSTVGMAWTAPTTGENGGTVFPDQFKYNVYPVSFVDIGIMVLPVIDYANPYATGVSGTSYDLPFNTNEGEMDFTYFAVAAENESGLGDGAFGAVVTGAPYSLPVKESVANQQLGYFWEADCDDMNYYLDGGLYLGTNASDGDGCNFELVGMAAGYATLASGKIALAGTANPVVKFDAVNTLGNSALEIYVTSPVGKTLVKTITPGTEYADYTISLADYKDADWVRVTFIGVFTGTGNYENPIAIVDLDNIQIVNLLDKNLSAMSLNAPARVNAGNDITAVANVKNQGKLAVAGADYTVKFTVNGEEYIVEGVDLAPEAKAEFAYTVATNVASSEKYTFKAEVVYDADEDLSDNATSEVTVKVSQTKYPTVANVVAASEGSAVVLNWDEPNLDAGVAVEVTDDFESYEPFQFGNAIGDWTLVDGDGTAMGGMQNTDIPNLNVGETTGSFFVMNQEAIGGNETFDAVSGVQYLSTMFAYNAAALDDWLISPVLCGDAQTISFFAKSYSSDYPDAFEVLYSTTDMATESFVKLGGVSAVPQEWNEYTYDLPTGAKYFAIHCNSYDAFMLFIDNVTYTPAAVAVDLEIVGYNVYRNGVKLNEEPVAETSFTDTTNLATDTTYTYGVSAVYTVGESPVVNADITTGVDSIDAEADGAIYYNMQGVRVAKPAKGEAVIRMVDGKATKTIVR